jgi:DNA replication and repair protein RecF
MPVLERLTLTDFRSYPALSWQPGSRIAIITGPNGSGKTNVLEALSLLSPGRGLRGARMADLARIDGSGRWAAAARFGGAAEQGGFTLGTGTLGDGPADRRTWRLDGAPVRSHSEVATAFTAIWITPQMDSLFQESASGRRRFLDRLVWALDPGHARQAACYDHAMAERNRLLAARQSDDAWLAGLEASMARHAVALAASRSDFVARINVAPVPAASFPRAVLSLVDPIADRLAGEPALAVEDWLRSTLAAARERDAAAGAALTGAHRADLAMNDAATGTPASLASTGQRKALLIGIILAQAALVAESRALPPALLLDEPMVHLDRARRADLLAALARIPGTILVTGTDRDSFSPAPGEAAFWRAGNGQLERD